MSTTLEPKHVPGEIIARWPVMALSLWRRSFAQQAALLLTAAMFVRIVPDWSMLAAFLIAPSLFIVSFVAVQMADEKVEFSWRELMNQVLPGALKLGRVSLQFAAGFGLVIGALAWISSLLLPAASVTSFEEASRLSRTAVSAPSQNLIIEFLHFCATWTEGVMAMVFLGMFIVAIYQGVFGVVLHAQEGMPARASRLYGWQAWQVNSESIENALRAAPAKFWYYLAAIALAVICAFQTVYLSPIGLVLATYIPSITYVAYRSIFYGRHENVPAPARMKAVSTGVLAPAGLSS